MAIKKDEGSLTQTAIWLLGAKLISFAFTLALPLFLVRHLNQHEYGIYKQLFLIINLSVGVLQLGFPISAFYFFPRHPQAHTAIIGNIVAFLVGTGSLVFLLLAIAPRLMVWMTSEPGNASYSPLVGLAILTLMVAYFFEMAPIITRETRLVTFVVLGAALTRSVTVFGSAVVFGTIKAVLIASILQQTLQSAALLYYLQLRFPGYWKTFDLPVMGKQIVYSLHLAIPSALLALQTDLHQLIVQKRYGAEFYAVYANGCMQIPLVAILIDAVGPLLIRQVSQLQEQGDTHGIIRLMLAGSRKLAAVFFPLYALLTVVGYEFIVFMFRDRYAASVPYFLVNITLIPLAIFLFDPIFRAYPQHYAAMTQIRVASFLTMLTAVWVFVNWFGPIGATVAVLIVNLLDRSVSAYFWGRVLHFRSADAAGLKDLTKLALSAALAALVTEFVRMPIVHWKPFWVLATCSTVFVAVYLAAVALFDVPTPEEWAILRRRVERVPLLRT